MGVLTDDMTRLRGEIDGLREARHMFNENLARGAERLREGVSAMQATFRSVRAETASKARADREAFMKSTGRATSDLRRGASEMQSRFRAAHADMARRTGADRSAFVQGLKGSVSDMQAGFRQAFSEVFGEMKASGSASLGEVRNTVETLKKTVGTMRQEFAADVAGAHHVFFGGPTPRTKPRMEAKPREEEAHNPPEKKRRTRPPSKGAKTKKTTRKSA